MSWSTNWSFLYSNVYFNLSSLFLCLSSTHFAFLMCISYSSRLIIIIDFSMSIIACGESWFLGNLPFHLQTLMSPSIVLITDPVPLSPPDHLLLLWQALLCSLVTVRAGIIISLLFSPRIVPTKNPPHVLHVFIHFYRIIIVGFIKNTSILLFLQTIYRLYVICD